MIDSSENIPYERNIAKHFHNANKVYVVKLTQNSLINKKLILSPVMFILFSKKKTRIFEIRKKLH